MWDHIIKNGTIITSSDRFDAHIYIKNGKIAAITSKELPGDAYETTDAQGKYVMSGFIDTHVHSRDGYKGAHYKEDFFHSSMAAAVGGITTIYEMPNCNPAIYCVENLIQLIDCITPKAHVDFGVWGLCLGELNKEHILPLAQAGVVAFKYFWGYAIDAASYQLVYNYQSGMENVIPPFDQGEIFGIFRDVAKTGKALAIHAENFDIINYLTNEVKKSGDTSYQAMLRSRPAVSETTIINTAILFAKELGTHLHILHLAAGDGVEIIRKAQRQGVHVTAETCPHYLALTDEDANRLGAMIKGYPPVRTKADQQKLWDGINEGTISHVCSDHAPHSEKEKAQDLWSAPAGMATIETMSLIMANAVNEGKITIHKMVEVLSEQPARTFGTYPDKGSLLVGSDADIVILDMDVEYIFDQNNMHSRTKMSPYNGLQMKGKPYKTILRGKTIAYNGEIVGAPSGRFIRPIK